MVLKHYARRNRKAPFNAFVIRILRESIVMSEENDAGKYVCTGGFIISGMIAGSFYGGTGGAAAGGAPAVPGVIVGALGGALWAAAICTRPAVKRFFQIPVDKLQNSFDKSVDVSSLNSELRSFIKDTAPDMASKPDAAVAFMLEYLQKNRSDVFSLASDNQASVIPMLSADAKRGMDMLRTAKLLT
jgi:hypothetical protein